MREDGEHEVRASGWPLVTHLADILCDVHTNKQNKLRVEVAGVLGGVNKGLWGKQCRGR